MVHMMTPPFTSYAPLTKAFAMASRMVFMVTMLVVIHLVNPGIYSWQLFQSNNFLLFHSCQLTTAFPQLSAHNAPKSNPRNQSGGLDSRTYAAATNTRTNNSDLAHSFEQEYSTKGVTQI
jgi:hypothetical protein